MSKQIAPSRSEVHEPDFKRPRYLRGFVWTDFDVGESPTVQSSLFDPPLPNPPATEFQNAEAMETLRSHPHLFRIVCVIKVARFEQLLLNHPNQPFVKSVVKGLREGFWPWADTQVGTYPVTHDASNRPPKTAQEADFIRAHRDSEIAAGRFSESFGPDLLPGMYSMPIQAVPKPHSEEQLRLVADQSAGVYSVNSMIPRSAIAGARLDSIRDLVVSLLEFRRVHGSGVSLLLFKSDVTAAYRQLPVHPLWQLKQIITIDHLRHVDHNNSMGNRGAQRMWAAFMALVMWIALHVWELSHTKIYTDDAFGFEVLGQVEFYKPYDTYYPRKQARLLKLWDYIGLPHKKSKQEFSDILTIIGFEVDPNKMIVSMPMQSRTNFLAAINEFLEEPRHRLQKWQQLGGWANWVLNAYPLLKPGLSNVYAKCAGKTEARGLIYVNDSVRNDLRWMAKHIRESDGILVMKSMEWEVDEAGLTLFGDASGQGMGVWDPASGIGHQCVLPCSAPADTIFFFEALAVCAAVHLASGRLRTPKKLVIYTDNTNTLSIFNTLRALPPYNPILKSAVSVLLDNSIDLRVVFIPGVKNIMADALSRFNNKLAYEICPYLEILVLETPRNAMGVSK
jgi:hypothetical protein